MTCPICIEKGNYSDKWDAYFCKKCDIWIEPVCKDPKCHFQCWKRPDKPSEDMMDVKIKTAKKKMDEQMNKLLKEDKKLDKKRDHCEEEVKKLKHKK